MDLHTMKQNKESKTSKNTVAVLTLEQQVGVLHFHVLEVRLSTTIHRAMSKRRAM